LKITASIEARMTSSRLPGKVMMPSINKISMLEFMINRIRMATLVDEIIVATTTNPDDDIICNLCENLEIKFYRGSENDVLARVLHAHNFVKSDIIVELTGDCPLIDPEIINCSIEEYFKNNVDYASNSHIRSYPDGFDVQVFSRNLLEEVSMLTNDKYDRENVSSYIYRCGHYKIHDIISGPDLFWPDLRVTLDDHGDLLLITEVINHLYPKLGFKFSALDVVNFIKRNKHLLELNKNARITVAPYQKIAKGPRVE